MNCHYWIPLTNLAARFSETSFASPVNGSWGSLDFWADVILLPDLDAS